MLGLWSQCVYITQNGRRVLYCQQPGTNRLYTVEPLNGPRLADAASVPVTLDDARTQLIFLRGYLSAVDMYAEISPDDDPEATAPYFVDSQVPPEDRDVTDPPGYLVFSPGDRARFEAAWAIVQAAALATGRFSPGGTQRGWSPFAVNAGAGVTLIDEAFAALQWRTSRFPWGWVLGGVAVITGGALIAAMALKSS